MSKRHNALRQVQDSKGNLRTEVSHTESDDLLPDPEELRRYNEINQDILPFIMNTMKDEVAFRHNVVNRRLDLAHSITNAATLGIRNEHKENLHALYMAFILCLVGMILTVILLYNKQMIEGSIFFGTSLAALSYVFLRFKNKQPQSSKQIVTKLEKDLI